MIPMLFAVVPGTPLYHKLLPYIEERGFDFQDLNGKLLPFLEFNRRELKGRYDLKVQDYYDIESFMFRLNEKVRERTFRPGADTRVSKAFRKIFMNYQTLFGSAAKSRLARRDSAVEAPLISEFHGSPTNARKHKKVRIA